MGYLIVACDPSAIEAFEAEEQDYNAYFEMLTGCGGESVKRLMETDTYARRFRGDPEFTADARQAATCGAFEVSRGKWHDLIEMALTEGSVPDAFLEDNGAWVPAWEAAAFAAQLARFLPDLPDGYPYREWFEPKASQDMFVQVRRYTLNRNVVQGVITMCQRGRFASKDRD